MHVVCAALTEPFLGYTQAQGNDLSTPRPGWASRPAARRPLVLCAARWEEARRAGVAPPVVLEATHHKALQTTPLSILRDHAADGADRPR